MTQLQGFFEKNFTLSPDYCGASARMSPLAVFTMFQAIAAEHAERIGVGGAAMARRGAFWLTLHSRVDFFRWPALAQEVTAATWPEHCEGRSLRCFRSYSLRQGDQLLALGRTQWAVLGEKGRLIPFAQSGFPEDFPFVEGRASRRPPPGSGTTCCRRSWCSGIRCAPRTSTWAAT